MATQLVLDLEQRVCIACKKPIALVYDDRYVRPDGFRHGPRSIYAHRDVWYHYSCFEVEDVN